ncbi:hypothetical protein [Prauserella flavalba]|uniref:hypothetical protein n=1 Tax=Prauserella flavalba TaxID=1477506 RepID=UPI0036E0D294
MAGAYDLADLIAFGGRFGSGGDPAGGQNSDLGFHQGVITEWNSLTGENTLMVAGGVVSNIPVLSTADSVLLNVGDTVGLIRFKSTYFILGRIASPGGGAQLSTRQAFAGSEVSTTSSSYIDLAGGPVAPDVYVGTSRRALVMFSAQAACGNAYAEASIAVSGASDIAAGAGGTPVTVGAFDFGDASSGGDAYAGVTSTAIQVFDASVGLNSGLNTFTMQYRRTISGNYSPNAPALFSRRRLVILPY